MDPNSFPTPPPPKTPEEREAEAWQAAVTALSRRAEMIGLYFAALMKAEVPADIAWDMVRDWHRQLPLDLTTDVFPYSRAERAIHDIARLLTVTR